VLQLPDTVRVVATHSSGNHGQALAWAAAQRNLQAYIVMPDNAPEVKKAAVAGYGATIVSCAPTLEAREQTLQQVVANTGAHFVHPYDDPHVIAGQGTCAMELLQQVPELDHIIAPVGGGGLLAGTALAAHFFGRGTTVYAGEPEGANDAWQSFRAGTRIPLKKANTIADGLRTSLGHLTFPVIMNLVSDIFTVSDAEILSAQHLIIERMKIVIEPSCAVPLAAILRNPKAFRGKRVGIILTGGNADLAAIGKF
jgi:threonine dehydratase